MTQIFSVYLILPGASDKISVWIGSENQTIGDLMNYIGTKFEIKNIFTLNINECILLLNESIEIIKQSDIVTVITETAPYFPFCSDLRIKLDLSSCSTLKRYSYALISSNGITTLKDLKTHISELYFIDNRFTLWLTNSNTELRSLCELKNEDVVIVVPELN